MIHPARFLSGAGQTSKKWDKKTLESSELTVLSHYPDAKEIFPTANIKGGVAITIFEKGKTDGGYPDGYVGNPLLSSIKTKVYGSSGFGGTNKHVSPRSPFRFNRKITIDSDNLIRTDWLKKYGSLFKDIKQNDKDLSAWGLQNSKRVEKFIDPSNVISSSLISSYKLFVPKASGKGDFGEKISSPFVADPKMICNDTFLSVGEFRTKKEAQNLLNYTKTKFARALLGILKTTHNSTRDVWKYVPWQDFTKNSDIDWSKSIEEIDQQLYKKYGLDKDEIKFIETNVKEME
jgi:hypothetical protein